MKDEGLRSFTLKVLESLTERERKVLRARFGIHLDSGTKDLEKLAAEFDVTRAKIREIEQKALKRLRGGDDPDVA